MGVDQEAGGKGLIGEVAMIGESNREGDCVSTDMVHKLHAVKEHQEVKLHYCITDLWSIYQMGNSLGEICV
jgi:hypothetical protein